MSYLRVAEQQVEVMLDRRDKDGGITAGIEHKMLTTVKQLLTRLRRREQATSKYWLVRLEPNQSMTFISEHTSSDAAEKAASVRRIVHGRGEHLRILRGSYRKPQDVPTGLGEQLEKAIRNVGQTLEA